MARIFAAFAAKESGRKSARIRRKMLQNAEQGLPHGSVRPFGYEADKITLRELEAAVVREMVERYVAGQSLLSLTVWLNESGIAPAAAKSWQTSAVRQILCSGSRLNGFVMIFSPASLTTGREMAAQSSFWVAGPKAGGTATRPGAPVSG